MLKRLLKNFRNQRYRGYTVFGKKYKPMLSLLDELRNRNIKLEELKALEVFGRDGLDHTTTYADKVKSLEVWEIDEELRSILAENLPTAVVRIVDSFEEVKKTTNKYDFIVIDNAIGLYHTHCDHLGLFPDPIFNITEDESLLVINIIPHITEETLKPFPYLLDSEYMEVRKKFYNTDSPAKIPMDHIVGIYKSFIERNNYKLIWHFQVMRNDAGVFYLVFGIKKKYPA